MFRSFFSRYFGFEEPVDRRTYLRTGIALMALKYAIDAIAIHEVTGHIWTPLEIYPQVYWRPIAEWLLTRIHTRVLEQVAREAVAASS